MVDSPEKLSEVNATLPIDDQILSLISSAQAQISEKQFSRKISYVNSSLAKSVSSSEGGFDEEEFVANGELEGTQKREAVIEMIAQLEPETKADFKQL